MRVKFSDAFYTDHGGKLVGTLPDISNGQRTAIIEIDHALPGIFHAVPLIDVTPNANGASNDSN